MDPSNFECSICQGLLFEPCVGRCGHDFCKHCLMLWKDTCTRMGKTLCCPLCRMVLVDSNDSTLAIGVCLRLKSMLEQLFPEQTAERRKEVQRIMEDAALKKSQHDGPSTATRSAVERLRRDRERLLRVRRILQQNNMDQDEPVPSTHAQVALGFPASSNAATQASPAPAMPLALSMHTLAPTASAHGSHMAVTATLVAQRSHQASGSGSGSSSSTISSNSGTGSSATWMAPQVNFTMGWYESGDSRRKRRSQGRYSRRHR